MKCTYNVVEDHWKRDSMNFKLQQLIVLLTATHLQQNKGTIREKMSQQILLQMRYTKKTLLNAFVVFTDFQIFSRSQMFHEFVIE